MKDLVGILEGKEIDLKSLKESAFNGCPDSGSTRALCWRLLLGALPRVRHEWDEITKVQRDDYKAFVNDFIIRSEKEKNQSMLDPLRYISYDLLYFKDQFSNTGQEWDTYFKDNEVLTQIDKDARRLYPDLGFFSLTTKNPANLRIHIDYKLGCLRERIERANLATFSSVKQRNGAKSMEPKKSTTNDDEFCKMEDGEEANWEGTYDHLI